MVQAEKDILSKDSLEHEIRALTMTKKSEKQESCSWYKVFRSGSHEPLFSSDFSNRKLKLRDLVRMHLRNLCGSCPSVGTLSIDDETKVVRIPNGVKFRIQSFTCLSCSNPKIMDLLQSVLSPSSFTMKRVWLTMKAPVGKILRNPIIQNCESLELTEYLKGKPREQPSAESIINLNSKFINIRFDGEMKVDTIASVAHHWIKNLKEIGSKIRVRAHPIAEKLEEIKNLIGMEKGHFEYDGTLSTQKSWKCSARRINDVSALVVYADLSFGSITSCMFDYVDACE